MYTRLGIIRERFLGIDGVSSRGARWALGFGLSWIGLLGVIPKTGAAESTIQFNRDIRPLFADYCTSCHGPDNNARKAGLRLDTKEGIFEKTPKRGPAVVPGNLEKSELWHRVTAKDPDDIMPPPKSHKVLKPEEKEKLKQWILEGAPWQGHWAYIPPQRSPLPEVAALQAKFPQFKIRNPIDAFVAAKLVTKGLSPAPEADRRTLARRVALDLTGLPPAPEKVAAFLKDRSDDAYEKYVHQLLASAAYGEHRARYWLDAARYADTHGLHFDNYREMWPYRDWVIRSFNRNQPFNEFTVEQIAGDLLPNATEDQKVATGFQRCNMTTNEGGTIEDENLANYANDRVTTMGWVFLGTTINCCACHDHKFDPFTQKDFYSMAAFFRNTKQTGFDRNIRESDLYMIVPQSAQDRERWHALPAEIQAAQKARAVQSTESEKAFESWVKTARIQELTKDLKLPGETIRIPLNEGRSDKIQARVRRDTQRLSGTLPGSWTSEPGPYGAAPIFEKDQNLSLGDLGDFDANEPFSAGAWVKVPKDFKGEGAVIAKMGGEEEKYRGWDLIVRDEEIAVQLIHRWSNVAMEVRSNGKSLKRGEWQHVFFTYDGSGRTPGLRLFVNGAEVDASRDNNRLEGSIRTPLPLRIGRRERNDGLNQVAVQDVRICNGRVSSAYIRALAAAPRLRELVVQMQAELPKSPEVISSGTKAGDKPSSGAESDAEAERKKAEKAHADAKANRQAARDSLLDYFRITQHSGWQAAHAKLAALESEQEQIRGRSPVSLIQEEKKDSEPMAQVLFRGQYDKPKDKVTAATPAVLPNMPEGAPRNRLGLAQWVVAPENPLTARVTVNRFWQEIFGVGLVKSADDFGSTGESPVNQELLDWLAVEFREKGWNVKQLMEWMVTSSTYRQSAETTREKAEKDPQNRFLSRGPRFRMDAEMVRDYALAASGLLVPKIGGPSVHPYQPPGVWEAVAMPESNTRFYEPDHGEALYRRSLYTFWKRAAPPAIMDIFNAPSREVCAVRRERTNTPLQALATLNDPQFVEAARHLAEWAITGHRRDEAMLQRMADRVLLRPLSSQELQVLKETLESMRSYYRSHAEEATRLLAVGESKPNPKIAAPDLASATMVANQLFNLDEALNK